MTDDPFGDLREEIDTADDSSADEQESDVEEGQETETEPTQKPEVEPEPEPERDPRESPGFEFQQDLQRPIYPPKDAWAELEEVWEFDIDPMLKQERVRNLSSRELHSAMVRLAAQNPDQIKRLVLEERGIETAEDEI